MINICVQYMYLKASYLICVVTDLLTILAVSSNVKKLNRINMVRRCLGQDSSSPHLSIVERVINCEADTCSISAPVSPNMRAIVAGRITSGCRV
jgi:hypothetical protein